MASADDNRLGGFLRARRAQLSPADVGLESTPRRRVSGLRREEVAMLARISSEYYLRLEQGRVQHPSDSVIVGLARALRLDDDATAYLFQLARPAAARHPPAREAAPEGIRQLLDAWTTTPAYVQGRVLDVLASNRMARALSPIFTPGVNLVRSAFLDPAVKALYRDWDRTVAATLASLRYGLGGGDERDDPAVGELVSTLTAESPRFAELWSQHDVKPKGHGRSVLEHPLVGRLDLRYEKLAVASPGVGQSVVIYHAEPGSVTERRLAELAAASVDG
ncbi:helix-turn-helix transcriptional regulator [Leifsonia sp. fls2-241-R2A-40a]|uniref:helix-turn-helix transcriptional regulator n=1 Tax=Leifsonia sp. fls2-241-R2A-40a TaxID=3040290 RepID=UPI00254C68F5|nr:helix-turn-helix transcriptional regulator [Leifsonia sp. fls2-241-R2A-40a]